KFGFLLSGNIQPYAEDKVCILCWPGAMGEELPVHTDGRVTKERAHLFRPLSGHLSHLPKSVALHHFHISQVIQRQILGLALDGLIAAPTEKARYPEKLRDVLGVVPVVKLTLRFGSDISPYRQ